MGNIIRKLKPIKKENRMEILELEALTITEMKNSLNEFNSRLEMAEGVSQHKTRTTKTTQPEK